MPVFRLTEARVFPDPELADPDGLLAVGGDLSVGRLLLAYRLGIFPWYGHGDPLLWWSPDPRCVLEPSAVHVSRRLQRRLRQGTFRVTINRAFGPVVRACAQVRLESGEETWLLPEMQAAYAELHELGYAHSVEVWQAEKLAGGLYGVALGPFFFGESMFHFETDASKVGLVRFSRYLAEAGFELFDCQVPNPHLMRMGAVNISRQVFLQRLRKNLGNETILSAAVVRSQKVRFPGEL